MTTPPSTARERSSRTVAPPRSTRRPVDLDRGCHDSIQPRRGRVRAVTVPFFSGADVERAVSPHEAYDAVKAAFIAHAKGDWTMQPKLYVTNYPAGDFRAMPALGGGHALLKWVTSFPGQPGEGPPHGDRARAALRRRDRSARGAARRGRGDGAAHGRCRRDRGRDAVPRGSRVDRRDRLRRQRRRDGADVPRARRRRRTCGIVDPARAAFVADRLGATVAASREEALACDIVVTVTPGTRAALPRGIASRRPARLDDGSRRARQGRGRSRQSSRAPTSSATTGSRRATAASSRPESRRAS